MKLKNKATKNQVKKVYDQRAKLDFTSGSNDFQLKKIEQKVIYREIKKGSRILELGCGNGETLIRLAENKNCNGIGLDISQGMINLAKKNLKLSKKNLNIKFKVKAAPNIGKFEKFDFIITQRCIGNLQTRKDQRETIKNLVGLLKKRGKLIMIEDCIQSHQNLNNFRKKLGLYEIDQPWFNFFLDRHEIEDWQNDGYKIEKGPISVGSTYYFLSRVVYAKLAKDKGTPIEKLKYVILIALSHFIRSVLIKN